MPHGVSAQESELIWTPGPDPVAARRIVSSFEPTAWAYCSLVPDGLDARASQVRHLAEALARDGAPPAAVAAISDELHRAPVAPARLAVFADADGRIIHQEQVPGAEQDDRAGFSLPADVIPLLEHHQERPPFVSVVIDRAGADVTFSVGGSAAEQHEVVVGPDDEIEHNAPGGWAGLSQSRFQRRATDSWLHNAKQVAARVNRRAAQIDAQAIVVAGDQRAVGLLLDRLSVPPTAIVSRVAGSRAAQRAEHDAGGKLTAALAEVARMQTERLLDAFADRLDGVGLAVQGVGDTLAALAADRVAILLVDPAGPDAQAWFGARGGDIFATHDAALLAAAPVHVAPVVAAAIRSTLVCGGRVRILPAEASHRVTGGIGAVCRFATGE